MIESAVPYRVKRSLRVLGRRFRIRRRREVSISQILMGNESGCTASKYAHLTSDLLRPSTPIACSPHVQLLQHYETLGDKVLHPTHFESTSYFRNALKNIDLFGKYFDAFEPDQIRRVAKRFLDYFDNYEARTHLVSDSGHSPPGAPIAVRPIKHSDCFQLIDGHHRCAIATVKKQRSVECVIEGRSVLTPLQELLLEVLWSRGKRELYQPINAPEITQGWTLVRRCSDRLEKMRRFLDSNSIFSPNCSYLDVGSSYGWFVSELEKLGYNSLGVERDPFATKVGQLCYGIADQQVANIDCVRFLRASESFDVVSCFSVLHHFALGKGAVSAEEFVRLLDRCTRRVLFVDTGQDHEKWFRTRLAGWNVGFIEEWLKKNTTFSSVQRLGNDEDGRSPYAENYRRMLFACSR